MINNPFLRHQLAAENTFPMNGEKDVPLGVKMLADHLVKVKLQYEEQINDLIVRMHNMEKEKEEMRREFRLMEDELEMRRNELYQMKRSSSSQYVVEERENWKAVINQQKQVNEKLQRDLEISKERVESLQQQLNNISLVDSSKLTQQNNASLISDDYSDSLISDETTQKNDISTITSENSLSQKPFSIGPPQPQNPLQSEDDGSGEEDGINKNINLKKEIDWIRNQHRNSLQELENIRKINSQLTDQFIRKVDELERNHMERENMLLSAIDALKLKLDLELEKKWKILQELKEEDEEASQRGGLISYLWG